MKRQVWHNVYKEFTFMMEEISEDLWIAVKEIGDDSIFDGSLSKEAIFIDEETIEKCYTDNFLDTVYFKNEKEKILDNSAFYDDSEEYDDSNNDYHCCEPEDENIPTIESLIDFYNIKYSDGKLIEALFNMITGCDIDDNSDISEKIKKIKEIVFG